MTSTLTNLTPHPIVIYDNENNIIATFPSSGILRLSENPIVYNGNIEGVPIHDPYTYGDLTGTGLIDTKENIIVSAMVADVIVKKGGLGYVNVFSPDMGQDTVRDPTTKQIVGTKSLIKWL